MNNFLNHQQLFDFLPKAKTKVFFMLEPYGISVENFDVQNAAYICASDLA